MRLNKYAGWGRLPPSPRRRPSALPGKLDAIALPLNIIARVSAPGGAVAVPSPAAFRIIACLGQVRDAVCDQSHATRKSVNDLLDRAMISASAQEAHKYLSAQQATLVTEFENQFRELERGVDFELQRRERLAELVAFESKVAANVK